MDDIRGEVGALAEKYALTGEATAEIHKMFCDQAVRWDEKVRACEDRIRNQRAEINRLQGKNGNE